MIDLPIQDAKAQIATDGNASPLSNARTAATGGADVAPIRLASANAVPAPLVNARSTHGWARGSGSARPTRSFGSRPVSPVLARRLIRWLCMLAVVAAPVFLGAGCSWFQRQPQVFEVPPNLARVEALKPVQEGDYSAASLSKAYPEMTGFGLSSSAIAERRVLFVRRSMKFLISFIAENTGRARLLARHPADQTNLFEVVVNDGKMCVFMPLEKALFEGPIPEGVSPFGRQLGVEPWDLLPIVEIGQRVAASHPACAPGERLTTLFPGEGDPFKDGLKKVEFDTPTGLPRHAIWTREGREFHVDYQGWTIVDDPEHGGAYLLPSRFEIHHPKPKGVIRVEVRQYNTVNPEPNEKRFECPRPAGVVVRPLEEYEKVITGE